VAQGLFRFPVQWVNRPDADFRGFAGVVASGILAVGDAIKVLPSGREAVVARIVTADGDQPVAQAATVPTLVLDREIDVSRGDVIVSAKDPIRPLKRFGARLLWMAEQPHDPVRKLRLKLASTEANVAAIEIAQLVDIHSYAAGEGATLTMNSISCATLALDKAVVVADHIQDRILGSFILIDAISGATIALGIVDSRAIASGMGKAARDGLFRRLFKPTGEKPLRSIVKAITWRATGSADTFLLAWLFTQSAKVAVAISATEVVTKLFLYYGHERLWARSTFGLANATTPEAANSTDGAGI
jgi:sulfate adenylyltransferase subunit 1 (EFTu-like GTPase family)/uncharacterized membrane protein